MQWENLLFLHWPVRLELIRPLIPPEIEIETFDGSCWIGVVPFRMTGVRPRFFPGSFDFPELNVRTYVRNGSKNGVWFFSLDAASWPSVRAARWFGMPYYDARMSMERSGDRVNYRSLRTHNNAPRAEFSAIYRPIGEAYHPAPGTLDHWLTERYCLYAAREPSRVVFGDIHHPPWPLQSAEVEIQANTMAAAAGIELPEIKPLAHFARFQQVIAWRIVTLERM
jgi:uncharacterized protein YqjF (DUF2071 family)